MATFQIQRKTDTYTDGELRCEETVNTGPCPDCGSHRATHTRRQLYTHTGVKHDGFGITIDCPECKYYEYIFCGPDI